MKLVCDLRTEYERTKHPDIVPGGAELLDLDVLADGEDITEEVTEIILGGDAEAQAALLGDGGGAQLPIDGGEAFVSLESAKTAYAAMFERFAEPGSLPAMFHCSAGKDRTGWGTAAFLTLLGVPRSTVDEDYLLSNEYLAESNEETLELAAALVDPELLPPVLAVAPEYLQAGFDTVQADYGSFAAYLTDGLGLDPDTIERLREEFLTGFHTTNPDDFRGVAGPAIVAATHPDRT